MQIHQVLVSASPGDAITNDAFEIRSLLRRSVRSDIFAQHVHPCLAGNVIRLERYDHQRRRRPRDDVLIYHASIGDFEVHQFMMERRERIVLIYHNISPSAAFIPYDRRFAELLTAGRHDLVPLRERVLLALADSRFNADELVALGYSDVRVLPPIVEPNALHGISPDERTSHGPKTEVKGPVLLYVGQILPHKRPEFLVQAFHVLTTYLVPEASLVLVGNPRLPRFHDAVVRQIRELGLYRAEIVGQISAAMLRSFYDRADVFVTASDHEGFCVPLLEAMSFGLPIVARATSAIPETLNGAGLLVDPGDGPVVFAEAIAELIGDVELRRHLGALGSERLRHFDPAATRVQLLEQLLSVV